MTTPFDKRILWIHWKGQAVSEQTIGELAQTVRTHSPNAAGIALKTSDGANWQGQFDNKAAMAINGPNSIRKWIQELNEHDLETHLWCVVRGDDVEAEARVIIQACNVEGVKSMILDVESGPQYFGGKTAATARELITKIRDGVPDDFHLALCLDARGSHPRTIHIDEWVPHVQSLHPMVYHWHFSEGTRNPRRYLDDAFTALEQYNLPIVPMLQAYPDPASTLPVPEEHVYDAGFYSFQKGAAGVTYFRLGNAGPSEFRGVARIELDTATREGVIEHEEEIEEIEIGNPKFFQVVVPVLRVRSAPSLEPRAIMPEQQLRMGQQVEVDPDSRTEADGYVWWRHSVGWSAERPLDGSALYLAPMGSIETTVPQPAFSFSRLPMNLDDVQWVQYFGNTVFAYHNGVANNYHGYSQGLHGGFDLGHTGGVPVFAGVHGTLTYKGNQRKFTPNRVDITIGSYLIIYGHLAEPTDLAVGQPVTPDTVVGKIDFGAQHVHLEVRYANSYIYNPLLFMPESMRNDLIGAFPPTGSRGFYSGGGWNKWLTPLEQPVIELGGVVIGPPH